MDKMFNMLDSRWKRPGSSLVRVHCILGEETFLSTEEYNPGGGGEGGRGADSPYKNDGLLVVLFRG